MTRNDKIQNYLLNLEDNWEELSVVADLIENELAGIEAFKFSNPIANDDAETVGIMVINRVKKRLDTGTDVIYLYDACPALVRRAVGCCSAGRETGM